MDPSTNPTAMPPKDYDKLDRKVRSMIHLCLSDSVLLNVFGEESTKKLWEKLGNLYKSMENHSTDALSVRLGHTKEKGKSIGGRSKSRGRSKYPGNPLKRLCWKCGKPGHFKKNCRSKSVERGKGSEDTSYTEKKSSIEEGDVYLDSIGTQS